MEPWPCGFVCGGLCACGLSGTLRNLQGGGGRGGWYFGMQAGLNPGPHRIADRHTDMVERRGERGMFSNGQKLFLFMKAGGRMKRGCPMKGSFFFIFFTSCFFPPPPLPKMHFSHCFTDTGGR